MADFNLELLKKQDKRNKFIDELGTKFDELKSVLDKYNNEAISFGYSKKEGWFISLDLDCLEPL